MFDITALGEILIDFTPSGTNGMGMPLYAQNPGGAPANVLAQSALLGSRTAFIGKVGQDGFGTFLRSVMERSGIDTRALVTSEEVHTTLAFVQLDACGDRSFSFYRNPGADILLRESEVDYDLIRQSHIFHFGSLSLTDEPARSATVAAVHAARESGCLISYDPNYRPPLWPSQDAARTAMLKLLPLADILKLSEEELTLLTGEASLATGTAALAAQGPALIPISLAERGAYFRRGALCGLVPAFQVDTVDTTGAGDAFLGAILHRLRHKTLEEIRRLGEDELREIVRFGNAAGGLTTAAKGAIPAMPTLERILSLQG